MVTGLSKKAVSLMQEAGKKKNLVYHQSFTVLALILLLFKNKLINKQDAKPITSFLYKRWTLGNVKYVLQIPFVCQAHLAKTHRRFSR